MIEKNREKVILMIWHGWHVQLSSHYIHVFFLLQLLFFVGYIFKQSGIFWIHSPNLWVKKIKITGMLQYISRNLSFTCSNKETRKKYVKKRMKCQKIYIFWWKVKALLLVNLNEWIFFQKNMCWNVEKSFKWQKNLHTFIF